MFTKSTDRRSLLKAAGAAAVVGSFCTIPSRIAAQGTDTIIIGKSEEAVGWDPAMVTASSSFELMAAVYENLIIFDDDGQPVGILAESWDQPDETTYVFKLREGVTFHNDAPMTAEDVKFSFDRLMDPDAGSVWASQFEPVESVEATDELTVTFKLKESYGPFLSVLTAGYTSILPNSPDTDFQTEMIGTGAYKIVEYTKDTNTVLAAHEGYWREGQPATPNLVYNIMPEETARLAAVRTAEINITTMVDPVTIDTARADENVTVIDQDTSDYYLLGFNTSVAPFDNLKVRQALSMAIDRQAIIDSVFFGAGQVSGPIAPTLGDWANPIEDLPNYTVDRDGAKALLEEAGVTDLTFSITVGANRLEFVNIALVIQDQLKEIGVTAELDQVEWGTFIDKWVARDFQSFVSFNGSGNDPDRALFAALTTGGSVNAFEYSNEELDALLAEGRKLSDFEERKAVYQEAEMLIAEEAPLIFISTRTGTFVTSATVESFAPSSSQTWMTLPETTVGE